MFDVISQYDISRLMVKYLILIDMNYCSKVNQREDFFILKIDHKKQLVHEIIASMSLSSLR